MFLVSSPECPGHIQLNIEAFAKNIRFVDNLFGALHSFSFLGCMLQALHIVFVGVDSAGDISETGDTCT